MSAQGIFEPPIASPDQNQSVYRERLLEHLLIGELLKHAWLNDDARLEVARGEIDRTGYDVVLEAHGVIRHVQFKTSASISKTNKQNVHIGLAQKPSGCVIWSRFDSHTLQLGPFLFFGAAPGKPLPSLEGLAVAKHTKGDSKGKKGVRPNLRVLPRRMFKSISTIPGLYAQLFGTKSR
jgi:hypothetical protein